MSYRIVLAPRARKEFDALDHGTAALILDRLKELAVDPRGAAGFKALHGGGFRLRVGDYRILFHLEDDHGLIVLVHIAHRRDVYRR